VCCESVGRLIQQNASRFASPESPECDECDVSVGDTLPLATTVSTDVECAVPRRCICVVVFSTPCDVVTDRFIGGGLGTYLGSRPIHMD
jgi:hypothetical protein